MSYFLLNNKLSQKVIFLTAVTLLAACDDFSLNGKKTQSSSLTKSEQIQKENQAIDIFNKNVAINVERLITTLDDNSKHVKFIYTIKNRGKADIKSIAWNPVHTYKGNILYTVPIQINFAESLTPGSQYSVTTDYDLAVMQQNEPSLTTEYVSLLEDPNAEIRTLILAKGIKFTNGDILEVN